MNILDYLDWRGDLLFEERPFNEVDNLILSELVYLNMDGLVPADPNDSIPLPELLVRYKAAGYDQSDILNDPLPLLEKAASAERFSRVRVGRYVNRIDSDQVLQFAAATFYLNNALYIAFRGTDNTITGWREDFNFAYMDETPGQSESVAYVNAVAKDTSCPIWIGGHSKGGNFAVYAASFCDRQIRDRILKVYSNDGPGFVHSVVDSENYASILSRTEKIIPESSLVGILLSGMERRRVVKSSANGILQHNPYSWDILGARFDYADARSPSSIFWDEALSRWMDTLSDTEKADLVSAIFDSLEASGVSTLSGLKENLFSAGSAFLDSIKKISPKEQESVGGAVGKLFAAGRDTLYENLKKKFGRIEQTLHIGSVPAPDTEIPQGGSEAVQ